MVVQAASDPTLSFGTFLLAGILLSAIGVAYMMPTILSVVAREKNWPSILVINLFFGWTIVGYLVAIGLAGFYAEPGERRLATASPAHS